MSIGASRCVGLALLMVTALLPILMFPLLGLAIIGTASAPQANPTTFLFLSGFTFGLALECWNFPKRIARLTPCVVGNRSRRQIAGFMLATAS